MWGIPETAWPLQKEPQRNTWPTTHALPVRKAGVHAVDYVLAYAEARKMEASFPREKKHRYTVPEI